MEIPPRLSVSSVPTTMRQQQISLTSNWFNHVTQQRASQWEAAGKVLKARSAELLTMTSLQSVPAGCVQTRKDDFL